MATAPAVWYPVAAVPALILTVLGAFLINWLLALRGERAATKLFTT